MLMKKIKIFMAVIFLLGAILISGCNPVSDNVTDTASDTPSDTASVAATAQNGDTVQVEYTGTLADGTEFDTSVGAEPLEFTLGQGEMIPAFEAAIMGMKMGQKKTFTISAEDAYGPYYKELVAEVPRSMIPNDIIPEVGMYLQQTQEDGSVIVATITEVTAESVTLDANHPLAGKKLTFEVELVNILPGQ
jgi:peptidylprolyl isomerase